MAKLTPVARAKNFCLKLMCLVESKFVKSDIFAPFKYLFDCAYIVPIPVYLKKSQEIVKKFSINERNKIIEKKGLCI